MNKQNLTSKIFLAGIFGVAFLMISTIHLTSSLRHQKNSEETSWHNLTSAIERLQQQNALLEAQVQHLREKEEEDNQNERLAPLPEQNTGNQELQGDIEAETNLFSVLKKDTTEAAIRKSLLSPSATEEQIKKALFFMPDVVAEVGGTKITKQQIVDLLLTKKISQQVLTLTSESYLRNAMHLYVDQKIDTEILKQKAKAAGFVPSEELVKTHFDYSIKKLSVEQVDEVKAQLKKRGLSLDAYRDAIAKEADIQENASIAAYEEKFFVAEAEKKVTDADVIKFYNENRQKFFVPENITVAHILIQCEPVSELDSTEEKERKLKDEKLAKEQIYNIYADLLKNPTSFDKFAQEKSDCPSGKSNNGKLLPFDKNGETIDGTGRLDPDFTAAAFKLEKVGAFTKPVKTQFGYHIIKLVKQNPKGYMPLDKVKGEIYDSLVDEIVSKEIQAMLNAERAKGNIKVYSFTLTMAASLLKSMPERTAMTCELLMPKASPGYPLMGELKRITLLVVRDEMDKRPVHADIVMPAKSTEAAQKIQKACQNTIDQVYREAAKIGKIPEELVNAFTVTRNNAEVAIHVALPDDMAKYLFTQFAVALQEKEKKETQQ